MVIELSSRIEELLATRVYTDVAPGCAVGIYLKGEPLHETCRGVRHLGEPDPITPTTNFRLASATKQFTACAVLTLAEGGSLSLTDPVTSIFPDLPPFCSAITVRHLIGHTSGVKDYEDHLPNPIPHTLRDADVLEIVRSQTEGDFAPGSKYHYSNTAYALLAMIVEKVSGKSFPAFLHERFFLPAGMINSLAWDDRFETIPQRAFGHVAADGDAWLLKDQGSTSSVLGDGGIYTSIREYALWDQALREHRILPPSVMERALEPGSLDDGTSTGYAFGWRIEEKRGLKVAHHTGSTTGFNTFARRIPSLGLCVVYLSNRNGAEPRELAPQIEDLVLDHLGIPS